MRCADPAARGFGRHLSALLCALAVLPAAGGTVLDAHRACVRQQRYAMGTMFEVFVYGPSAEEARAAASAALAEVERLDRVLSHFDDGSELSRLMHTGWRQDAAVSGDLFSAIETALTVSRLSEGAFDITVGPLVRTWRDAHDDGRQPTDDELSAARRCVGPGQIELRPPDRIRLRSSCVALDLGGIGKGYAVDRALAVLAAAGIRHALVNAGRSSIGALGHPPGRSGWPVVVGGTGTADRELLLRDASVSTSESGDPAAATPSGIVHPHTGRLVPAGRSVTVVAPSAAIADAASTALLLLDAGGAQRMVRALGDVTVVTRDF